MKLRPLSPHLALAGVEDQPSEPHTKWSEVHTILYPFLYHLQYGARRLFRFRYFGCRRTPQNNSQARGKSIEPAFQKVVDRSNPGKIRVTLPQTALKEETKSDEPPAKKAKTGGGAFSGFNSFLPAPKRTGQSAVALDGGRAAKKASGPE